MRKVKAIVCPARSAGKRFTPGKVYPVLKVRPRGLRINTSINYGQYFLVLDDVGNESWVTQYRCRRIPSKYGKPLNWIVLYDDTNDLLK